jgi:hypothetical protein
LSKLTSVIEKDEFHREWIFIVPDHVEKKYSPVKSIPLLTKQSFSRKHKKTKTTN